MLQGLTDLGIEPVILSRAMLADSLTTGCLPKLPESIIVVDASIDYSEMRKHEADKHALISRIAKRSRIELIASFSSGVVDFDSSLISNPFYHDYKRIKQDNLAFFRLFDVRLFYPKIYTLIGSNSYMVKTTGWVQVLDDALRGSVSIAHPWEPRSWVSEDCVRRLFAEFVVGDRLDYLDAPVCGTFHLADIVAFAENRRQKQVAVRKGQATAWLNAPYVAPNPCHVDGCVGDLHTTLTALLDASSNY